MEGRASSRMTLSVGRTEARKELESQQSKLEPIFTRPVRGRLDYSQVRADFDVWDDYTQDLLRKIFEHDDLQKEFASVRHTKGSTGLLGDDYLKLRQSARRHWQKLASIVKRLDLYAEPKSEKSSMRGDRTDQSSGKSSSAGTDAPVESKKNWRDIEKDYDITKPKFGRKINFVSDSFRREIIFRDVEHAHVLASLGYSKPAVILAGGVIEELLRLYLEKKKMLPKKRDLNSYINACEQNGLLKTAIQQLADSVRYFRNLVHLREESSSRHTISKATAKGAVASIFTIVNDLQKCN